jgi:hypothetical protein
VITYRSEIEEKRYRKSKQKKHTCWIVFGSILEFILAPKSIKKGFKNRSLARGVYGGAPGLIFDRLLIIFGKRFDVLLELFSSYFEEASGCTFRSFCF